MFGKGVRSMKEKLLVSDICDIKGILMKRRTELQMRNKTKGTPKGLYESRQKEIERINELVQKLILLEKVSA